ncbi:MAG: glycosyltransferase family 39 protein [Longimicrobiales bacterium]
MTTTPPRVPAETTPPSPGAPGERLALVLLLIVAAITRFWGLGASGIDHFDEGGYALSAQAIAQNDLPGGMYPLQHFLSPPMFFGASGLLMRLLGTTSDVVPIALSGTLGVLTVFAAYMFARRAFGPVPALVTAALLTFSDYHILYSGAGLTDVAFSFWFVVALALYAEADARRSIGWAVLAGVATGLAWNTKYHGWLAGVVAGVALAPYLLESSKKRFIEGFIRILVAAAVATVLYLPWFYYVTTQEGGYTRLAAETASFLHPLQAPLHVWAHLQHQLYLDGWLSRLAPAAAVLLAQLVVGSPSQPVRKGWGLPILALGAGVLLGGTATGVLLALVGLTAVQFRDPKAWIPLAFLLVFTGLSPLYTPYARLLLPWVIASFLLAGLGVVRLVTAPSLSEILPSRLRIPAVAGTGGLILLCFYLRPPWFAASTFQPSDGFESASGQIAVATVATPSRSIPVLGEPGVAYYLRRQGRDSWHVDTPGQLYRRLSPGDSIYLVGGRYSRLIGGRDGLTDWSAANPGAVEPVARFPVQAVSDVRLLDDLSHGEARAFVREPGAQFELVLYRVVLPELPTP